MLLGRNRASGVDSGADLATLKILHFDVCEYHGEVRHGDAARSGDFIAGKRLGSGCRGSQTIVKRRQTVVKQSLATKNHPPHGIPGRRKKKLLRS